MSKKVKNLITNELITKFKPLEGVAVISPRGIDGIKNNLLRRRLRENGLRMTVVKNSLARRATQGTKLSGAWSTTSNTASLNVPGLTTPPPNYESS